MFDMIIVGKAICPNCEQEVTEIDANTGMCEPCFLECQEHEAGDCVLRLAPRGRIFYSYRAGEDMGFCFSLFSEVGAYYQPTFTRLLNSAKVSRKAKETAHDVFDTWVKW